MNKFTTNFNHYACIGDSIECEIDGFTFRARVEHDVDYSIDDDDSHNVDQSVTGCDEEQQRRLLTARDAFFKNEWFYCGIVISASFNGVELDGSISALWGIECNYPYSNNDYLLEVANELLDEAKDGAEEELERLREAIA